MLCSVVVLFLCIVSVSQSLTRSLLLPGPGRTLAMVKPDALSRLGDILETIHAANLIVTKAKMTTLSLYGPTESEAPSVICYLCIVLYMSYSFST